MKRFLSLLAALLMLCGVAAAEGMTIVVEPEDYEFNEGDEFAVTVYFENNPGLCAADITISYDPTVFEVVGDMGLAQRAEAPAMRQRINVDFVLEIIFASLNLSLYLLALPHKPVGHALKFGFTLVCAKASVLV